MYSILCSGYPEETRYKLYERLGKCQIKLNRPMKAKPALLIASQLIRKSGLGEEKEKQLLKSIAKLQESIKKSPVISSTATPVWPLTQFLPLFWSRTLEGLFELTRRDQPGRVRSCTIEIHTVSFVALRAPRLEITC